MTAEKPMQKLDLSIYDDKFFEELRALATEDKPQRKFTVPECSDDLELDGVNLLAPDEDNHLLITNIIPKCGKCLKGKNGLNYVMTDHKTVTNQESGKQFKRSNTVKLCEDCGEINQKLLRIERLKLPVEALNKTLRSFEWEDNGPLYQIIVEGIFENSQGLYLYGPYGVGKTHLIYGIARRLIWEAHKRVKLMNFHEHLTSIKRSWDDKHHKSPEYNWLDKYDTVIIDEFGGGYEGGKKVTDWVRMTTSEMLMEAHKKKVQVILVTNIGEQHKHVLEALLETRVLNRLGEICPIKYKVQGHCRRPSFF